MSMKSAVRSFGIGLFVAGATFSLLQMKEDAQTPKKQPAQTQKSTQKDAAIAEENKKLQQQLDALMKENKKLAQADKPAQKIVHYTINIQRGMGTQEVSTLLKKQGIIENSDDFEAYIINAGKSSNIQLGKTKVNSEMSSKELLAALTTRK